MNIDRKKAYIDDAIKRVDGCLTFMMGCFISFALGILIGVVIGCMFERARTTPVGKIDDVDSIIRVNDSIKIKVEQLDSIKDAKVIEVSTLDNDSTLKLFYKLVSE